QAQTTTPSSRCVVDSNNPWPSCSTSTPSSQPTPTTSSLDRGGALVRVHPDHHSFSLGAHESSDTRSTAVIEPGGQRCFEFDKPFLSLSWPWRRPARAGEMRATRSTWAAAMRATDRAPGPSLARSGPNSNETSSRDVRASRHWVSAATVVGESGLVPGRLKGRAEETSGGRRSHQRTEEPPHDARHGRAAWPGEAGPRPYT